MLDVLGDIWDGIRSVPYLIADFFVMIINGVVAAVGVMAGAVLGLLPSFPDAPDAPAGGVLGLLNWVIPLGPVLSGFALLVTAWMAFLLVKVALKWVKAL